MSEYDLIPDDAYENLPEEANDKFVVLVRVAQANLGRLMDQSNSNDYATEIRAQFISTVAGIAEALGVEGLPKVDGSTQSYDAYQTFQIYLAGVVSRVRLQGGFVPKPFSVELGRITKEKIRQEISQLRYKVEHSDLPPSKQTALIHRLDDLEAELDKKRLGFAKTMAIAASIMAVIAGGTTALANGPKAEETVLTILRLIGQDKDREEHERLRLAPPPKPLPDLRPKPAPVPFDAELDDDVPF